MSGPVSLMSIEQVQQFMGDVLPGASPEVQRVVMSICEHLKDAERWRYFEHNLVAIPDGFAPKQVRDYIDKQIEEFKK